MIQKIKYNGYSANPSDYECSDGDLALSVGLVPEDSALKPVLPPKTLFTLDEGQKVVCIHETSLFKYYIVQDTSTGEIFYIDADSIGDEISLTLIRQFSTDIYSFEAIGNTLVILASDGMHYFLWKSLDEGYLYLGSHLPELPISFGLQGEMVRTDEFSISFDEIDEDEIWDEFSDDNKTTISNQVLAKVNKFIADKSTNAGKFIYPFLVRYAYRLYDSSLTMQSAPILMVCSSDLAPQVFYNHITGKGAYTDADLEVVGVLHTLDYAVIAQSYIDELLNWTDIVRSVDIFVSQPIYTYDQSGECTRFVEVDESDCYCICKHTNQATSTDTYPLRYQMNKFSKLYAHTFNPDTLEYPTGRLMLPTKSAATVKEDISSCSLFYLLKSIKLESLTTERTTIDVEDDYLQSLTSRETLDDDYDSHDTLIPQYSFAYNQRLNIANISKQLFDGFNAAALFCHSDGYVAAWDEVEPTYFDYTRAVRVYVFIKQDGRDIIVQGGDYDFGMMAPLLFLYYPNVNAYKAVVVVSRAFATYYEVPLEQHDLLNGAVYFGGWDGIEETCDTTSLTTVSSLSEKTVDILNKIYTSEVNNPFYFPVSYINTVGTGTIIGISAAAKALSQGQFGQFPLYAFSTEGVWALEVSDTGTYSAKQPITRDVCISTDSITQIDSAVLFATDRGIMHISGSEVLCISDSLKAEYIFSITDLPKYDKLLDVFNSKAGPDEQLTAADVAMIPFLEFLADCRMVYDYTNQRIFVYNTAVEYAYVFSLKSQLWGMVHSKITSNINSYPEALAMQGTELVNVSLSDADGITALAITRPFKIGDPDMFKTIDTIIQRGYMKKDHVSQILFGSNDLFNWHIVWSSGDVYMRGFRGTPYKAFRIALVCSLDKKESIYGFTVQHTPRLQNRPR